MRFVTLVLIILTAMITQSCKITMLSPLELIARHGRGTVYILDNSMAIRARGGFKDTLIIGDDPEGAHGKAMKHIIASSNRIPEENIVFFQEFLKAGGVQRPINFGLQEFMSQEHEQLRKATKVVHLPLRFVLRSAEHLPTIQKNNILFVVSNGNMEAFFNDDRDVYNSSHAYWNDADPYQDQLKKETYQAILETRATSKVISVTSTSLLNSGEVGPNERVTRCGDIKESCFTIIPEQSTSRASARLAAIAFYLAQFWETPEEVVEVLSECTIDVGEPGIDREYGQGIANLLCPQVLKKEIEVVSAHSGETEEEMFSSIGGNLEGIWQGDNTTLQVHLPTALKETLRAEYTGTVNGTVEFKEKQIKADFTVEAEVSLVFLLSSRIRANAEDIVQVKGVYTTVKDTLRIPGETIPYTYTTTEDSLHLVRSYTLNEVLALLPDPLGSMVDMASPDFFVDNPIQLRMSFAKAVKDILLGDFDEDGTVSVSDFLLFANAFGASRGDASFNELFDLVPDGIINVADFLAFVDQFGKTRDS